MSGNPQYPQKPGRGGQNRSRKNRSGKKTPFRKAPQQRPTDSLGNSLASPSQVADMMRQGEEAKSGQFAEALAGGNKPVKRERLHKVLAQSGHGSRRDMEILIAGGRVTINGNVATAGAHVSPGDKVLIDHRLVPIRFTPELPRVLLYHKPEGEIVSNDDPGNRISVFDNLPRVENAKWIAIGRLDFNTSGLLIFTTSGDLANKMMHPRFEVEREYAVRILGELTEEQIQRLKDGINIDGGDDEEEDEEEQGGPRLARFTSIEARSGPDPEKSTANNWYHVVIKEGRNREIRRMFEALGLTVSRLMRVRFGKVELPPRLMRGAMQELDPGQVKDLLIWAGVSTEGMDFAAPRPQQRPGRHEKQGGNRPARPPRISGHPKPRHGQPGQQGQSGQRGPDVPVGDVASPEGPPGRRRKARGRKTGRKNVEGLPNALPRPVGEGQGQPRQGQRQGQRQNPRARRGPVEPGNMAEGVRPPAGKAKRGRKVRKGPRGQESAPQRINRAERAEPLTAWTGGQPFTSVYGRQRGEGKAARQPKIIRTVTRRPQRPEEENNS